MSTATTARHPRRVAPSLALAASVGLVAALLPQAPAAADDPPFDRGIEAACPDGLPGYDRFVDVPPGATHGEAISCIALRDITQGSFVGGSDELRFNPLDAVTRQQMASFVARTMSQASSDVYTLPGDPPTSFDDVAPVHQLAVDQLAAESVVEGFADGTFAGQRTVNRQQVASFVARAVETVTDTTLPRAEGVFDDVSGTHTASIEKLAAAGIVQGRAGGAYDPTATITRQEMATVLARTVDLMVTEELAPQPVVPISTDLDTTRKEADGDLDASLVITDVAVAGHLGFDRIVIELEGEGDAGYAVEYDANPTAQGSGAPIDYRGETALAIAVQGVLLPPDVPPEIDPWDGDTIDRPDGRAILELQEDTVFEGIHTLVAGATAEHPMDVVVLDDPQRIVIDVLH